MKYKVGLKKIFIYNIRPTLVLTLVVAVMMGHSCISLYESGINEDVGLISIDASLIKGRETQTVSVIRSTALTDPVLAPIRGCSVRVFDEFDNEYVFYEQPDGTYTANIEDDRLVYGRKYKLQVITLDGDQYESTYEPLNYSPPIDTLYFEYKKSVDDLTGNSLEGLQFYVDIKASDTISRYYRWKLSEEWEYTSTEHHTFTYVDKSLEISRPDPSDDLYRCWQTHDLKSIYLSNTVNLMKNEKRMIPLEYVTTQSDRLRIKYCMHVTQYSLSEGAFNYWSQNKLDGGDATGLYTQQPGQRVSNFKNVNDTLESVLGYFWTSSMSKSRILVPKPSYLHVPDYFCDLVEFDFDVHGKGPYPIYIWVDPFTGIEYTASQFCFNCLMHGTNVRPDYW